MNVIEFGIICFLLYLAIIGMFAFIKILLWLGASDDIGRSPVMYRAEMSFYVILFIISSILTTIIVIVGRQLYFQMILYNS